MTPRTTKPLHTTPHSQAQQNKINNQNKGNHMVKETSATYLTILIHHEEGKTKQSSIR